MELSKVLGKLRYEVIQGSIDKKIENVCWDSRRMKPNSLFIAVKNRNVDRHDFVAEVVKNGAIAIVIEHEVYDVPKGITIIKVENSKKAMAIIAEEFYDNPSNKFNLIGVTGTNGKTSTCYFISQILREANRKVGIIGTVENTINGIKLKTEKLNPTTPDSIELQQSFQEMLQYGVTDTVMEVTSSALSQERVYNCDFDLGIFTNLTQDHLEEHGTMENYKNAKMKLFSMCKKAIVNIDDKVGAEIKSKAQCLVITYGIYKDADFKANDIRYSMDGVQFTLKYNGQEKEIKLKVPGKFSVYNILATIAACYSSGVSLDDICEAVKKIEGVPGRFQQIPNKKEAIVIVDYAHSPDSLENILNSVKEFCHNKIITVFGCGGNRDKTKRPIMGEIAGRLSDYAIITSDNPRKEDPERIIEEVEVGILKTLCKYKKIENRKEAIFEALSLAEKGDAVIIAGKGHETYQIIGDTTIHFDDKEVVKEYFNVN